MCRFVVLLFTNNKILNIPADLYLCPFVVDIYNGFYVEKYLVLDKLYQIGSEHKYVQILYYYFKLIVIPTTSFVLMVPSTEEKMDAEERV